MRNALSLATIGLLLPITDAVAQAPSVSAARSGVHAGATQAPMGPGADLCLADRAVTVVYSGVVGAVVGWVMFLSVDALAPNVSGDTRRTIRRRWIRASFLIGTAQGLRKALLQPCDDF